ncbi:MAG TPA: DUF6596 domain-containing protein [Actinophytocola sp.]|uniref:DUF6596 domain-containing protein n=1 Tax=Actinophytocola sp. TaxID=1872138 RepID=UPI002F92D394
MRPRQRDPRRRNRIRTTRSSERSTCWRQPSNATSQQDHPDSATASHPRHGEGEGLLALMLLTEARRTARIAVAANWSPLDDQDRFSWNVVGRRSRC